jgi:glucokinase
MPKIEARNGNGQELTLRDSPERWIAQVLQNQGEMSYRGIQDLTGLSQPVISTAVGKLEEQGVVQKKNMTRARSGGRPPVVVSFEADFGYLVSLDLGQQHARVGVTDLRGNSLLPKTEWMPRMQLLHGAAEFEFYKERQRSLDEAKNLLDSACVKAEIEDPAQIVGVAVGVPAPLDDGEVAVAKGGWFGKRPAGELKKLLQWDAEFIAANDAHLAALGELHWGAAAGKDDVLFVKWGNGIGGAVIMDGELHTGARGLGGEFGHLPIPGAVPADLDFEPGRCDFCGHEVCLERAISGEAILRQLKKLKPSRARSNLRDAIEEAWKEPTSGGPVRQLLKDSAYLLGTALAPLVTGLNPELIVVGGHFRGDDYPLIGTELQRGLDDFAMVASRGKMDVVTSGLPGQVAGALGGTMLVFEQEFPQYLEQRLK